MIFRSRFCFPLLFLIVLTAAAKTPTKKEIDSINNLPFDYKIANTSHTIKLTLANAENAKKIKYTKGLSRAYFSLGLLYYYQGKYDKNTFYMLEAIRLFDAQRDIPSLVEAYGGYGYMLKKRNMPQASYYMNKAIKLGKQQLKEIELLAVYDNYGVLKEMQSDLDSAYYFYNKSLTLKQSINDKIGIPYSLNKIALVNIMRRKFPEAKALLDKAYGLRVETNDKVGIAENLNFYGHYYKSIGDSKQAIAYFTQALQQSRKHNYKDLTQQNYQELSDLYEKTGDFDKALAFYKSHIRSKDSIQNLDLLSKQAELDTEFETEKKEKEILTQKANLAEKNLWLFGVAASLIISILLGYVFYNRQKMRNRQIVRENELKQALQVIETQNVLQKQRLAISRDLHDNIGSQLTFIISTIDNLKYGFAIEDERLKTKLSGISLFTRNTITELRDTIWAMNKDAISFQDLKSRIANYIENAKMASHGIQFDFSIDPAVPDEVSFSSLKGINIYRIIQEAINNSLKYAQATQVSVRIAQKENRFIVTIADNGKGFDITSAELGNGINNMKKRTAEVDGEIAIVSEINKGTEIKITVV